jgi:hypothetical protein
VPNTFANRARKLVVAPGPRSGFNVWCDVRRCHNEITLLNDNPACSFVGEYGRLAGLEFTAKLRMAIETAQHAFNQVFTVLQAPWCRLETAAG